MKAFCTLFSVEFKLSLRDMNMVIFALCMPMVVQIILGIIYGNRPAYEGAGYSFLAQSFGAVAALSVCAGGVMGLPLVVADYRQKKILKRFRVTPVSPALILAVQLAVYALYSILSLVLVYATAALFFGYRMEGSWILFSGAYALVMLSMFSVGMLVGGVAPDMKAASVLASILYFPMLVFSGATVPYEIMPQALRTAADFMPLTQGIKLLKAASLGTPAGNVVLPVVVMIALAVFCTGTAVRFFRWE